MTNIICAMPECQTTAGCQCIRRLGLPRVESFTRSQVLDAVSNARENFEFAGQAALDAAVRELDLAQAEIERVRMHLGNVLSILAELHQDDRCRALDEALVYYNASCPDKQIAPVDGYVTRLVQHGPLEAALAEDANA